MTTTFREQLELRAARGARLGARARRLPPAMLVGSGLLVAFLIVSVTAPLWAPYGVAETVDTPLMGMSWTHLFGTDVLGRDVFSRVVNGARDDLFLSIVSTLVAVVVGGIVGLVSGYVGGRLDELLMRVFEAVISIPLLVLALLAIAAAGPERSGSWLLLIGVVVLVYAPRVARMARSIAVDLVTRDFVLAARLRGESVRSIVRRELLPNATGVLLVEFGVRAGYTPILIGSLGFLGFGARPPSPEWGLMISENRDGLLAAPVIVLAPALSLAVLVIALNLFADGLARYLGRQAVRTP